jgi:hypothetical protein
MRLLAVLAAVVALPPVAAAAPARADNPPPPTVITGAATQVTQTSATLNATLNPNGAATSWRFEYGTTDAYGLSTPEVSAGDGSSPAPVEREITALTPDTTYHVRIVATNAAGISRGTDVTFRTAAAPRPPGVTSAGARGVSATGAVLAASVDPRGQATTYRFEYGRTSAYGEFTPEVAVTGTGSRTVTAPIAGLNPYTTYRFRLVATNASGTTRGSSRSFRTLRLPTRILVSPASAVIGWGGSVTLTGRVEGRGISRTSVAIERRDAPFPGRPTIVRSFTTASDGSFRVQVGPLWQATRLRLVTRSTNVATSPVVEILTRALVGLRRDGAEPGSVTLTGLVRPATASAQVSVQRLGRTGRWVRIARSGVSLQADGAGRYRVTVPRARRASLVRVVAVPDDGGLRVRGVSRELRIAGLRR